MDTGCQINLLSSDIASALGLEVKSESGTVGGIGEGSVNIIGTTEMELSIGSFSCRTKICFSVTNGFRGFGIFGLNSQRDCGMVIDTGRSQIYVQQHTLAYYSSKSELCRCAVVESSKEEEKMRIRVELAIPTVLPPLGNVITTGKLVFPEGMEFKKGEYVLDPVDLRRHYGLLSPRCVAKVGEDGTIPVLIKNPLPQALRMLRRSKVGFADLADVDEESAKDIGGLDPEPGSVAVDELAHPLDKIKLDHLDPEQKRQAQEMLARRGLCMARHDKDIGLTDWVEHRIELKPGCEEPAVEPQRSYPAWKKDVIDENIADLTEMQICSKASSAWRTFPVLARKKNSKGEWEEAKRFCLDLRKLNEKTIKHSRLLHKVEDVVNAMKGAKYFTTIDLLGAYNQVNLAEDCRDYTAFIQPSTGSQYRYQRMVFGLVNAGATFSHLADLVLAEFNYVTALAYLDDIVIFSATWEDAVRDVEAILKRLELAGLKARPEKCVFFKDSVELLGHVVSKDGVSPDGRKVEAIKKWPTPDNACDLLSFLATANFYRRFIRDFSKIAAPLYKLTRKDVEWRWQSEQADAFARVKELLCSSPVMAMPDSSKQFVVDTDWSRHAIGWVIHQKGEDGLLHPICYGSRSLSKSESRYPSTKGEFMGLCTAVLANRHLLEGADFVIRCDNRALSYLQSYKTKDLTFKTARLLEQLAGFGDFKVQFVPGKQNIPADALSRIKWKEMKFSELPTEHVAVVTAAPVAQYDWIKEQEGDEDLQVLKKWLTDGSRPNQQNVSALSPCLRSYWYSFPQFSLSSRGVVERVWTETDGSVDKRLKVVPISMRARLLEGYHEQVGHPGISRMYLHLREKYYWHQMKLDVTRHCDTCQVCQVTKKKVTKAPLVQHQLSYFNQRVFMDIKGPLQLTARGNAYYLVMVDGWSKWVGCYPIPDVKAETVYSSVYSNWMCQNGTMVQLHSDQGSSLIGRVAQEFVNLMNVHRTTTVSHHQMANGAAERCIKSTIGLLKTIIEEEGGVEWDLACPKAAWALNVTPSTVTGQTPFLIKHSSGEEAIIPVNLVTDDLPKEAHVDESVRGLRERQARLFKKVSKATGQALRRQKDYYDRNVRGAEIAVGDKVRYENHGRNPTLDKSFQLSYLNKLFTVSERLSDVNIKIVDEAGNEKIVHINQIKKVPASDAAQEVRRSSRRTRIPARLEDFDLSRGQTVE